MKIDRYGYVIVYVRGRGYMKEHRVVIEKKVGRILTSDEEIHHINHIKTDNRIENLLLVTRKEHQKYDKGWWQENGKWWKKCTACKKSLKVDEDNFHIIQREKSKIKYAGKCKPCRITYTMKYYKK